MRDRTPVWARKDQPLLACGRSFGAVLLALGCLGVGCTDESFGAKAVSADAGPDAPEDAAGGSDSGPDAPPVTPRRTLLERNPYGNTTEALNLLVDGDFEFSGREGQYGWLSFSNSSFGLNHETGGLCRSGVTCGKLSRRQGMLAYAVAAPDQPMQLSLWTKPADQDCGGVSVFVIGCVSNDTPLFAQATPVADAPDTEGWCRLEARTPVVREQPCLYLENDGDADVLIDDAVLVASPGNQQLIRPVVAPARQRLIADRAEQARRGRRYGKPGPLSP